MKTSSEPSTTALMAAAARAAHLIVDDEPLIFRDGLAGVLLGDRAEELLAYHRLHGAHLALAGARAAVVTRSRYTERRLAASALTQCVILGAGLDSFAYRSPLAGAVDVFEVDHPATQAFKREQLAAAGISIASSPTFVAVDLETQSPTRSLLQSGLDRSRPAFISWLGVTMYLTRDAIADTLPQIATLASGTQIVIEHMLPEHLRDDNGQAYVDLVAPAAADRGEPWLTFLDTADMTAMLAAHSFDVIEHVFQRETIDAALWQRTDALRPCELSVLTCARVR